jgi:hypothetical protein
VCGKPIKWSPLYDGCISNRHLALKIVRFFDDARSQLPYGHASLGVLECSSYQVLDATHQTLQLVGEKPTLGYAKADEQLPKIAQSHL